MIKIIVVIISMIIPFTVFDSYDEKENEEMETIIHRSDTRGFADHGWLKARHSFSFADYYNPDRVRFGLLRVLNDDIIQPKMGFGTHPHDNMEIITIPIRGSLKHKDSMGNSSVIKAGEVQVMSAGSGLRHSEFNASDTDEINLLQIWIYPKKKNIEPRYDQRLFDAEVRKDSFQLIVNPEGESGGLWINQDAWFYLIDPTEGKEHLYSLKDRKNGVYLFVIEGEVSIGDINLKERDAIGITKTEDINFKAVTDSKLLFIEVPME